MHKMTRYLPIRYTIKSRDMIPAVDTTKQRYRPKSDICTSTIVRTPLFVVWTRPVGHEDQTGGQVMFGLGAPIAAQSNVALAPSRTRCMKGVECLNSGGTVEN